MADVICVHSTATAKTLKNDQQAIVAKVAVGLYTMQAVSSIEMLSKIMIMIDARLTIWMRRGLWLMKAILLDTLISHWLSTV